jgi:hypothetical protein
MINLAGTLQKKYFFEIPTYYLKISTYYLKISTYYLKISTNYLNILTYYLKIFLDLSQDLDFLFFLNQMIFSPRSEKEAGERLNHHQLGSICTFESPDLEIISRDR